MLPFLKKNLKRFRFYDYYPKISIVSVKLRKMLPEILNSEYLSIISDSKMQQTIQDIIPMELEMQKCPNGLKRRKSQTENYFEDCKVNVDDRYSKMKRSFAAKSSPEGCPLKHNNKVSCLEPIDCNCDYNFKPHHFDFFYQYCDVKSLQTEAEKFNKAKEESYMYVCY